MAWVRRESDSHPAVLTLGFSRTKKAGREGKGLYHINAVDTVTQWQVVGCCETISEAHLLPVLEAILHQFPFRIQGFHSDNGSEFLNYKVQKLLNKLQPRAGLSPTKQTT